MKMVYATTSWQVRSVLTTVLILHLNPRYSTAQPVPVFPVERFATKTTYNSSLGRWNENRTMDDSQLKFCCQPAQVVVLARHGIRYPSKTDLLNMGQLLTDLNQHGIRPDVYERLHSVLLKFPFSKASLLAPAGSDEHRDLGYRFGQRFASLFRHRDDIAYVSSTSSRTVESQENFERGLSDAVGSWNATADTERRDDLLRFFDSCPRYEVEVTNNDSTFEEFHRFQNETFGGIASRIASHLGIVGMEISNDNLSSLFSMAAVEFAILGTRNWADLLDDNDINILEYSADLEKYYEVGYGRAINYVMSCPLIANIFKHIDDFISGSSNKTGVFYFGHAESVVPVLAALGLFHDAEPLRADTWLYNRSAADARQFCTSRMASFSVNVAFVLHDCTARGADLGVTAAAGECDRLRNSSSDGSSRYLLQLLVNERPVNFPFCGKAMCPYEDVRRNYAKYIDYCDFNATCTLPSPSIHDSSDHSKISTTLLVHSMATTLIVPFIYRLLLRFSIVSI